MSLPDWPPRMIAPRQGTEVRQVSKPPQLCSGCSRAECWNNGCQNPPAAAAATNVVEGQPLDRNSTSLPPAESTPPPPTVAPTAPPAPAPSTTWRFPTATSSPADKPDITTLTEAESPMKRKSAPSRNIQRTLCTELARAGGTLDRAELQKLCGAEQRPFENATYNAKAAGRIVSLEDGRLRLTKEGKAWVVAAVEEQPPAVPAKKKARAAKRAAKPAAKRKASPGRRKASAPAPEEKPTPRFVPAVQQASQIAAEVVAAAARSFRCGVFSDGSFHLTKNGQSIDLTPEECREMQRYLARNAAEV